MNGDDYLWDGTGTPDPEVARLEELLSELRYEGHPPPLEAPERSRGWLLAAAVLLAVGAGAGTLALQSTEEPGESWALAGLADCGADCALRVGEWLETGAGSARLTVADIGHMDVHPGTRLRLAATGPDEHRLELAQGRIEAVVDAPPRLLIVETPTATAVDLGCAYDLSVGPSGDGHLAVYSGWVALERPTHTATVPSGASVATRVGFGPGTPWFRDATPELRGALEALDLGVDTERALQIALDEARPRDTLSLWHLLFRVDGHSRADVLDRMAALTPWIAWTRIDRAAVAALDEAATADLLDELTTAW